MKPDCLTESEREILRMRISETLLPIDLVEWMMLKEHPIKTREIFRGWNELKCWGLVKNDDLNVLRLMIEYLHEYVADKQDNVGLRELMFFTIDRLRNIIRGKRVSTDRFMFDENRVAKAVRESEVNHE